MSAPLHPVWAQRKVLRPWANFARLRYKHMGLLTRFFAWYTLGLPIVLDVITNGIVYELLATSVEVKKGNVYISAVQSSTSVAKRGPTEHSTSAAKLGPTVWEFRNGTDMHTSVGKQIPLPHVAPPSDTLSFSTQSGISVHSETSNTTVSLAS